MYKVLLVDDEFMILDGISSVIEWEVLNTELIGTAQNGQQAMNIVRQNPPDIIITDIRMPGMDGLELVRTVHAIHPDIMFILLTGYSEFEYAKTAMQYGVKHYLLKPCSEESLSEAIGELVESRMIEDDKEAFVQSVRYGLERIKPYAKEQFLKEFLTNKTYGTEEWHYFGELFGFQFQSQQVRVLLFQIDGEHEYEHLFAVKNITEDVFRNPMLSSTVSKHVLILIEDTLTEPELFERIQSIRSIFTKYYNLDLTAALSDSGELAQVRRLYKQTIDCLSHQFYLGKGSLITRRDISNSLDQGRQEDFSYDEEKLIMVIKAGHWDDAERELTQVFQRLSELRMDSAETKSYIIQLFMGIIRLGSSDRIAEYLGRLTTVIESSTFQSVQELVMSISRDIALERFERTRSQHSQLVQSVVQIVHQRLHDEQLTLQMVSNEIYMNPDYVSKVFKREIGEKFTNYVMRLRMERALELLEQDNEIRISHLAEMAGFGGNSPYFSKVFKKHTGLSPSEYKQQYF
ncbi:response regulator [Paenibacillus lemnae]|uniref:Response regulator transcription factor n=1 Tax=Paenibacillus lemnae TaxID=1330551 RepID=A0A848M3V4_PAELE|nr:response regulator [Paenibacillus lemnae]NMO95465.1 response regulator transcription factor [Paenibacillus lemnae]